MIIRGCDDILPVTYHLIWAQTCLNLKEIVLVYILQLHGKESNLLFYEFK